MPFHPFSSPTGLLSARPAQRIRPRSSLSSAVRFYSVLCYGKNTPPKTSRLMQTRQRSPHASSHIPARSFRAFFQGRSQACRHPRNRRVHPRVRAGFPADPALDHRQTPSEGRRRPDKPIIFFCHSGNRTANASDLLERLAGDVQAYRLDGGISGWEKAGLPVEHISSTIPLFRQIQIAAGSLVLIGVIGSAFWHPFFWLSAFVGAGLVFAGISGFCGLGVRFRTCRGTGVEPVIRKIKNSGAPRQRYPVRRLACGGEPFQRDRIFQPTRLLTGASFHREKLSTRHTNGWGRDKRERPKPAAHPVPHPMPLFPGIWPKRIKPSIPCLGYGRPGHSMIKHMAIPVRGRGGYISASSVASCALSSSFLV